MKEFSRTSLPDKLIYNNRYYFRVTLPTHRKYVIIGFCAANNYKMAQVNVMASNLKGRNDTHGQPYKPTEWIYTRPALTPEHQTELSNKIKEADQFRLDFDIP